MQLQGPPYNEDAPGVGNREGMGCLWDLFSMRARKCDNVISARLSKVQG